MAERELSILVRAKGALQAARDIGKVDSAVGRIGRTAARGLRTAGANIARLGVVAGAGIALFARQGIASLADLEDATSQVDGAISQLGLTGQISAGQVATWANEIERNVQAAFDDKAIVSATATLLRFGKVTPENVRPAMEVMTDLAAKTGDVDSAAALLAKALADPEKAAGKLARAGVVLTKQQQDQIKALVKAGKTTKAQALLLELLAETTEGAAAASKGPYRDALNILADTAEDAQRALGEAFLPVLMKVSDLLSKELAKPETIQGLRDFGRGLAGGLDKLIDIGRALPWGTIGDSLKIAGAGAKTILDAFTSLPPWVQTAVITGWGLNKLTGGALGTIVGELGKGLIKGVLGMNAGVVNIRAGVVNGAGVGGAAGAGRGAGIVGGLATLGGLTLILDGLSRLPTALDSAAQGIEAANRGDTAAFKAALRQNLQNAAPWLGGSIAAPLVPYLRDIASAGRNTRQRNVPLRAPSWRGPGTTRELRGFGLVEKSRGKVDWAEISKGQKDTTQRLDTLKQKSDQQRTAVERTKGAIDWARMTVASKGDATVAAIRALKFNVSVTVPITLNASQRRAVARAQTGGTMNRGPYGGGTPGHQEY